MAKQKKVPEPALVRSKNKQTDKRSQKQEQDLQEEQDEMSEDIVKDEHVRNTDKVKEADNVDQDDDEDDYDEEEDEDYDPEAVVETNKEDEEDDEKAEKDEKVPDFSAIESATISQVRTRNQRLQERQVVQSRYIGSFETDSLGLVPAPRLTVDVDSIFNEMKENTLNDSRPDWKESITGDEGSNKSSSDTGKNKDGTLGPRKIKIQTSYAFAGKLITETKEVDEDSAEAKAFLNSTSVVAAQDSDENAVRSFVPVIRKIPSTGEEVELRIKLKRPSLIDKFMSAHGSKKLKLSTLEKSRLDWASFVDQRKIGDELKLHNKAGYLDKQDFLGRVQEKQDIEYQKAKEEERLRQWLKQQQG